MSLVFKSYDVFEHYDVDRFLHTNAILVTPQYRGRGIGEQLFKLNQKICTEFGLKLALVVLTSNTANNIAEKAGYVVDRTFRYQNNDALSLFDMGHSQLLDHLFFF